MPRNISSQMIAALQSNILRPAIFVEATFASGPLYLWSGWQPITWNGQTWQPLGSFGSVSMIEEASTVESKGMALELNGIDPNLLADVVDEFQLAVPAIVYLGLFDASGNLIPDPITAFSGRMDQPTLSVAADSAKITINCESRLLDMNVAAEQRYTNETQQFFFPNDLGMSFVSAIQDITVYWGRHPQSAGNFSSQGFAS